MSIEFVTEILFALKGVHDNYNDSENASHLSVIRLRVLEDPIVKFHSQELSISKDALETLEKALQVVKQFLDDYNESSMWQSCVVESTSTYTYSRDCSVKHHCRMEKHNGVE